MVDENSPAALIVSYLKISYNIIGKITLKIQKKIQRLSPMQQVWKQEKQAPWNSFSARDQILK